MAVGNTRWERCAWGDAHNGENSPCRDLKHVWPPENTGWEHLVAIPAEVNRAAKTSSRHRIYRFEFVVNPNPALAYIVGKDFWCTCGWTGFVPTPTTNERLAAAIDQHFVYTHSVER